MKYDLSILIVLYGCKIESSKTINSLFNSNLELNNYNVIIYNNGPELINEEVGYENIKVLQDISNRPLSIIYNEFIADNTSKYYAIFDHDSVLSDAYLLAMNNVVNDEYSAINVPYIKCSNKITGPTVNGKVVNSMTDKRRIIGIASGIIFSNDIVILLKDKFKSVFDEHFYLYGVDTSFFLRLRLINKTSSVFILPEIYHSLSRLENGGVMSLFRRKERSYDLGLMIRYYFSFEYFARFFLLIACKSLNRGKYKHLIFKDVLAAILHGKHYRSF